jgi:hypothetical protein
VGTPQKGVEIIKKRSAPAGRDKRQKLHKINSKCSTAKIIMSQAHSQRLNCSNVLD